MNNDDGIMLQMQEDGTWGIRKEPYATIEFPSNEDYEKLQEIIEKHQSGGWVPVGERLPEEYGCYLVAWRPTDLTAEDIIKNTGTVPHYYEMVEYDPDDEALWIGGIEQCDSYEILAWQPLPPAYKEVENEH